MQTFHPFKSAAPAGRVIFLVLFLSSQSAVFGQEWQRMGGDFYAVEITSEGRIFFVGEYGTVLFSDDQGATWQRPQTGTWNALYSVRFRDDLHGFIGGHAGTLLRTENGGHSWETIPVPVSGPIRDIEFPSDSVGFGLVDSGTIIRTTNGGQEWEQLPSRIPDVVNDLRFVHDNTGYATTANGSIYRTNNGGSEWTRVFEDPSLRLTGITFDSEAIHGYACSYERTILSTSDGGDHWNQVGTIDSGFAPLAIAASNIGALYVSGLRERFDSDPKSDGLLAVSRDSGKSWERLEPFRVPLSNAAEGIGFSSVSVRGGRIAYAGNAGAIMVDETLKNESWIGVSGTMTEFPQVGESYSMYRVAFSDADTGIATVFSWGASYTRFFRTFDGGTTWHFHYDRYIQNYLNLFSFPGGEWLTFVDVGVLARSTDAGTIWSSVVPDSMEPRPVRIRDGTLVDRQHGYAAADALYPGGLLRPAFYRTTDGGEQWESVSMMGIDSFNVFLQVSFPTVETGFVAGSRSVKGTYQFELVKTTDAGKTWNAVLTLDRKKTRTIGVHFVSELQGYLVEGADDSTGSIFSTEDGGKTWDSVRVTEGMPQNVKFFDRMNGFVLGFPSLLMRTTDGGESWNRQELWPQESDSGVTWFEDIVLLPDDRTVVLIGYGVIARKTYPEKLVGVPTEGTGENPAGILTAIPNPATDRVRFEWRSFGDAEAVGVRLYDAAGRDVLQRVVPFEASGVIELDVSELPAGTYRAIVEGGEREALTVRSVVIVR